MKRILFLAVASALALALPGTPIQEQEMNTEKEAQLELERIEGALPEVMLRGDAAFLERITADDFLGFEPDGRGIRKADLLARLKIPDYQLESLRHEDIRVRVFGNCAVATARTVVRGLYKGKESGGQFRYLRVWVRRQGRWQAVAAQSTVLPQP